MSNDTNDPIPPTPDVPEAGIPPLEFSVRARLSVMMFLQYFVWGAWWVTLVTYLLQKREFSGTDVGSIYSTSALAAIVSPFFVGMFADRFFATQRILAALHLVGAGILFFAASIESYGTLYLVLLLYYLCYMPTLALTNSLSFHHLNDPERQFPGIRVLGTIGWIVAGLSIGWLNHLNEGVNLEASNIPMKIAAGASVLLSLFCLTLPDTPPRKKEDGFKFGSALGLDALGLMKNWSFAVFVFGSFLICIPLQFYYVVTNGFLNEVGVENAVGKMTIGQMSEIAFMLVMPFFFVRLGVKYMLLIGMLCWTARYILFAFGDAGSGMWMLYIGIALHGICYDFFFVTGQIFVDKQATADIRGAAQGFIAFVTLGVGGYIGMNLAGYTLEQYVVSENTHNWTTIWLIPAFFAGIVMVLFAIMFREQPNSEKT